MNLVSRFFSIPAAGANRNIGLDFFRAFALLLVIAGHCLNFFRLSAPVVFDWFFLFRDALEMFFVLSGFLIGNLLFKTNETDGKLTGTNVKTFFKRRWFKTLPAYWLVIVLHLLAGYFIWNDLLGGFSYRFFTFTQNLTRADFYFFPVSYSLCIEEWFYLLLPLCLWVLQGLWPGISFGKKAGLVGVAFIAGFTGVRWYLYATQFPALHWDMEVRKAIVARLDVSMYGVLAACCFQLFKRQFLQCRYPAFIGGSLLFVFSLYVRVNYSQSFYSYVLYFTVVPFAFALWLPLLYQLQIRAGWLRRGITYISLTSYSYYLLHLSPIMFLMMHYWQAQTVGESFIQVGVFLAVSFFCSHLLYKYFERPVMDLRDRV